MSQTPTTMSHHFFYDFFSDFSIHHQLTSIQKSPTCLLVYIEAPPFPVSILRPFPFLRNDASSPSFQVKDAPLPALRAALKTFPPLEEQVFSIESEIHGISFHHFRFFHYFGRTTVLSPFIRIITTIPDVIIINITIIPDVIIIIVVVVINLYHVIWLNSACVLIVVTPITLWLIVTYSTNITIKSSQSSSPSMSSSSSSPSMSSSSSLPSMSPSFPQ